MHPLRKKDEHNAESGSDAGVGFTPINPGAVTMLLDAHTAFEKVQLMVVWNWWNCVWRADAMSIREESASKAAPRRQ